MKLKKTLLALAITAVSSTAALADIKIGVSLSLTGPGSGLGIPMQKQLQLFPKTLGGEKVQLIILDDATDPGKGAANARRFVTEDKVDLIFGSCITAVAAAMTDIAAEAGTVQIAGSPVGVPPGKDKWLFRLPQSNTVMGHAVVEHMKKQGVKTVGFLGYTDAYGQQWLDAVGPMLDKAGIKLVGTERFARTDTSVTPQALKLTAANPDAMLVVASGSGAAMPQMGLVERGYKGKVYQTHAAATPDLSRVGGKSVEGTFVVSGPALLGDQLADSHPSKKLALDFVQKFEKEFGANSRNQFAGHSYDFEIAVEKAIPMALKKAKPGTAEFRSAVRDSLENMGRTVFAHGVMNWTPADHWGYTLETGVMTKVVDGKFKVE
ncbi:MULTISPECIES: ABC transporter substrate-binding protein [unclassified Limnohabitans]|jgi:branched-chain amino acid transport system substrate-binding protein|uniref:ABC transporter substrate-binding protein n=1 Tax=unclassified Limnohabitans TaxID=2626134 RepID=UPI000D36F5F8|nr:MULTISPECIES: ABC transporter substrate-binding protein [unclassified Limnohabitans]PUE15888.1 branched-chain amino acid ABC transporter substrate-binding protein [Limnohabitans sp. MMS-10A-192]PUE23872.1 branched-chain amino acid ABC transporter substrate-binding protein [Limnohabitans sp. MMS-10A-160]